MFTLRFTIIIKFAKVTEKTIDKYLNLFLKLKRGYNKNLGRAPHKPILLLSIIELIEIRKIDSNRIFLTADLVLSFKKNWKKLVTTNHRPNFSLPFFHLKSEPFWHLITKPNKTIPLTKSRSIKSFPKLKETIAFAEIDQDLYLLLENSLTRELFKNLLLDKYFTNTKLNFSYDDITEEELMIENQILNEPASVYQQIINKLKHELIEDEFEEEIFVRGSLFKKTIPKIYNYSCCISGMKIASTKGYQMVDACHIHPFSVSKNDTISNGIALSPNLHRAFDRGLITINKNFIVRISPTIKENNSVFSLNQFEGKKINLPNDYKWYPSQKSLEWHNKEIFLL